MKTPPKGPAEIEEPIGRLLENIGFEFMGRLLYTLRTMSNQIEPKLSKWPFYLADVVLLGAAWFIFAQSKLPMGIWEILLSTLCIALGALLSIVPFVLEYRLIAKLAE